MFWKADINTQLAQHQPRRQPIKTENRGGAESFISQHYQKRITQSLLYLRVKSHFTSVSDCEKFPTYFDENGKLRRRIQF